MKFSRTILSVTLLAGALALAGCGGSSGPTEEELAAQRAAEAAAAEAAKQEMEAANAIAAASQAALTLDNMSDADAVAAVEALITTAVSEIGDLPAGDQAEATAMLAAARAIVAQANERLRIAAEAAEAARQAAEAAEAARIAAEAAAKQAAAEAAEAARLAAEAEAAEQARLEAEARAAAERNEAAQAVSAAINAAIALNSMSDADAIMVVEGLITAAQSEIEDLPADERTAHGTTLEAAQALVTAQNSRIAEEQRLADEQKMAQEEADREAAREAAEAMEEKAQNLLAVLRSLGTDGPPATEGGTGDPSTIMRVNTGYADADMKDSMTIAVMGQKFSEEYADASDPAVTSVDTATSTLTLDVSAAQMRVMGDAFSTGAAKTHTKDRVRQVGGTPTPYFSTPGSYHGVMGTYECTGTADCTSTVPADGEGLTLVGDWTFKPSNPDALVTDAEGLQYGWWATETDGSVTAAHVFYVGDALNVITGGLPTGHGGSATYKGGAMGKYAIHRGTGGMNDAGHFTADAELTATFGDASNIGISGKIDGFMGADGESRNWEVTLKKLTTHTTGVYSGTDNVVWKIGEDSSADAGRWEVATYGSDATATAGAPAAVAGGFQASHGIANGHMLGAFGAEKE